MFEQKFNKSAPSHSSMYYWKNKFIETGSIIDDRPRSGRPVTATGNEQTAEIRDLIDSNPTTSTALPRGSRSPTSNPCCGRGLPRANRGVRFYYNIQQQHQLLQTQNTISNNRVFDKPDH